MDKSIHHGSCPTDIGLSCQIHELMYSFRVAVICANPHQSAKRIRIWLCPKPLHVFEDLEGPSRIFCSCVCCKQNVPAVGIRLDMKVACNPLELCLGACHISNPRMYI